jgi:hypothetical protein
LALSQNKNMMKNKQETLTGQLTFFCLISYVLQVFLSRLVYHYENKTVDRGRDLP